MRAPGHPHLLPWRRRPTAVAVLALGMAALTGCGSGETVVAANRSAAARTRHAVVPAGSDLAALLPSPSRLLGVRAIGPSSVGGRPALEVEGLLPAEDLAGLDPGGPASFDLWLDRTDRVVRWRADVDLHGGPRRRVGGTLSGA